MGNCEGEGDRFRSYLICNGRPLTKSSPYPVFVNFHPGVTLWFRHLPGQLQWEVFQHHPHHGHCCPSHARAATCYPCSIRGLIVLYFWLYYFDYNSNWLACRCVAAVVALVQALAYGPVTLLSHEWHDKLRPHLVKNICMDSSVI